MLLSNRKTLALAVLVALSAHAAAAEVTVYMKPDGDDRLDGTSKVRAVASLQAAVRKALSQSAPGVTARHVVVLPGTYLEQTAVVRDLPDEQPLVIAPESGSGRPVFNGNGKGRTWLVLDSATGKPSRLTIQGLEITNYVTAVSLNGQRTSMDSSNGQNVIRQNVFRDIGQVAFPSGKPSTAAVRLVNSKNNQIVGNQFLNIRNLTGCSALHSIYIAHYSTGNIIEGNTFDGGCGATIKTRDASNNNLIRGNTFIDQSEAVFLDNFCDKDSRDDCTKEENECPSWGNVVQGNELRRLGAKVRKAPVRALGTSQPSGCQAPQAPARVVDRDNRLER